MFFFRSVYGDVPLENWRSTFYTFAAEYEKADESVSGMFWDHIDSYSLARFLSDKWYAGPDTAHHWFIEPSVENGLLRGDNSYAYSDGQLFHEVTFGRYTLRQLLHVDTRYDDDPNYPAHPDRFLRGRIEEATLQADWQYGFLRIGRQNRNWGPFPDRSLLLSANPYTYDAIEGGVHGSFFEYRHLFAAFPYARSSRDSDNGRMMDRYLTAHALNVTFNRWLTLGIVETVLFTRDKSTPDFAYLNPVSLYSVINTNQEGGGNLLLGFQWNIHPGTDDISFRGQVLLDDFQVDNDIATDEEPTHWGLDAGLFWRNPLSSYTHPHLLKFEYTYASEWLYTVPDKNGIEGERYMLNRQSLALPFTNGMYLRGGVSTLFPQNIGLDFAVSFRAMGGNTVLTSWQDNQNIPGLPYSVNKPVERRTAIELSTFWLFRDLFSIEGCVDLGWVSNKNNIASNSCSFDPVFSALLDIHYSRLQLRLPKQ